MWLVLDENNNRTICQTPQDLIEVMVGDLTVTYTITFIKLYEKHIPAPDSEAEITLKNPDWQPLVPLGRSGETE